jgi:hypothetical protein
MDESLKRIMVEVVGGGVGWGVGAWRRAMATGRGAAWAALSGGDARLRQRGHEGWCERPPRFPLIRPSRATALVAATG